ncbi:MAG: DinB family protein [Chlorobia bacterium]|nr:DinB family protein [Fimbriimonadaceae bacterium]
MSTMIGRPHAERLLIDLAEIREELVKEAGQIPPEQLDWAPAGGMKSYRDLLIEIGATELENMAALRTGKATWNEQIDRFGGRGPDVESVLNDLAKARQVTIDYLEGVSEAELQAPCPLPPEWQENYGGLTAIEPEELIRFTARHEYYHLGQIITMRWIQGHNPYEPAD